MAAAVAVRMGLCRGSKLRFHFRENSINKKYDNEFCLINISIVRSTFYFWLEERVNGLQQFA